MSFDDPAVRPLLRARGAARSGGPAAPAATPSSRRRSTGSASTAPTASIPAEGLLAVSAGADRRRSARSAFDGGAHVLVKLALARRADRRRRRGARHATPTSSASSPRGAASRAIACARPTPTAADGASASSSAARPPRPRWVGADAGRTRRLRRRRASPTDRRADWGLAARGALVEPGGPAPAFRLDRARRDLDRSGRPALRPGARRRSGTRPRRSTGPTPVGRRAGDRGRRRPGDDVPHRERGGRAGRAGPVPRPGPPALPRDPAGAGRSPSPTRPATSRSSPAGPRSPAAPLALSTVGGRASLQTLLDEPDFATAVVPAVGHGRGHVRVAARLPRTPRARPADPAHRPPHPHTTRPVTWPSRSATSNATRAIDPDLAAALARAVERRHHALRTTAGLNDEVFDALVLLAAGDGHARPRSPPVGTPCSDLQRDMDDGRRSAPRPPRLHRRREPRRCRRCTPATSCDPAIRRR